MLKYIFISGLINFIESIKDKNSDNNINEEIKNLQIDILLPSLIFFSVFLFYISAIIHTSRKKFYLLRYRKNSFEEYEIEEKIEENEKLLK